MSPDPHPWSTGIGLVGTGRTTLASSIKSDRSVRSTYASDVRTLFVGTVRVADILVVVAGAMLANWIRQGSFELDYEHWLQVAIACLVAANTLGFTGVYSLASLRRRVTQLSRVTASWTGTVLAVIATIYFAKMAEEYSRAWVLLWAASSYIGLVGVRVLAWICLSALRARGWLVLNVAVIGDGAPARQLTRHIEKSTDGDACVVGVFGANAADDGLTKKMGANLDIDRLIQLARHVRIDEIAVSLPSPYSANIGAALRKLCTIPVDVMLYPEIADSAALGIPNLHVPSVPLLRRPLAGWQIVVKRSTDILVSAVALLLFAPLMLIIAMLVKLDSPGPILFRQQRFGFNKQPITVYKFRTMRQDAALDTSIPQARRVDPRVTRIGRFLRRTSLDELPQLFNVLGGSMSLVGPRPHAIVHDEKYAALIDGYLGRHRVRPGITGWAQINGLRGETDTTEKMERRIEHDLYYIEHWSPLLDVYILFMTLFVGFHHHNAY